MSGDTSCSPIHPGRCSFLPPKGTSGGCAEQYLNLDGVTPVYEHEHPLAIGSPMLFGELIGGRRMPKAARNPSVWNTGIAARCQMTFD